MRESERERTGGERGRERKRVACMHMYIYLLFCLLLMMHFFQLHKFGLYCSQSLILCTIYLVIYVITVTHLRSSRTLFFNHFHSDITLDRIYPICRNIYFTENTVFEHNANIYKKKVRRKTPHNTRTIAMKHALK